MMSNKSLLLFIAFMAFAAPSYTAEGPGAVPPAIPKGYEVRDAVLSLDKLKTAHILIKKDKKEKKDTVYVFFDNRLGRPYDSVNKVVFSPDSKRFVYCAKKDGKEYFVLDGKESKPFDSV